ncbi:MAG: glycosyltransferase family 1 protein [Clostridia bacterium]|nr:glycosyltransferase family 1 protein [Clostridia bacterium]
MKVGVDARAAIWYRGTGIGTYTYQLIRNLHGLKDKIVKFRCFWPGDEYRDLEITREEVFDSIEQYKDKFWEEVHIPQRLENEGIDLYHVPQNGIGLPGKQKCPTIVTIHDLIPYVYPETVGKGYLKIFLEQMPRIVEEADKIITVSKWSQRDLEKILKVPAEKITITYEAPEPIYRPLPKGETQKVLREKYGLTKDYILYIGGFGPRKNVKGLINAYNEVYKDINDDVKLVFVGKQAKDFTELTMLIEALGLEERVIWTGFAPVQDLPYLYNGARVFVYPSFYEGFGLPPLEAMACGTTTITSNVSSIPEVVGKSALLVNPYNTVELAEALYRLLNNPQLAAEYGQKGLRRAKMFTWEKTAKETMKVYQSFM